MNPLTSSHSSGSSTRKVPPPYVDFAVWGPFGGRVKKAMAHKGLTFDVGGRLVPEEYRGPPTVDHWAACWRIFQTGMIMLGLAEQVRANEPGNDMYTLCRDEEGNYIVLELYKDEEALAAHGASEHFKAAGAGFKGLMAGAPEITRLKVVG